MAVSAGNLDSLVGLIVSASDVEGISTQSWTGTGTISTLTADVTAVPVLVGENVNETVQVASVSDTTNSVTLVVNYNGSPIAQSTFYAIGFGPDGILLSGLDSSLSYDELSSSNGATFNATAAIFSTTTIAAGTIGTFDASGSYTPGASPSPPPSTGLTITDTTTGQPISATPQAYSGPVAGLTSEYISTTTDSLNVTVTTPGWFIHTGSGTDAIAVSSGTNVLDGSTGSNFLTGGTGTDTFYVDDRGPTANIWSTINNFHAGDAVTVWGITQSDFNLNWVDGAGATGYTGLTLGATSKANPSAPNANLTLVGFTSADLTNGVLHVSFGTTAATSTLPAATYMLITDG